MANALVNCQDNFSYQSISKFNRSGYNECPTSWVDAFIAISGLFHPVIRLVALSSAKVLLLLHATFYGSNIFFVCVHSR
jgi:hypothetical protein